MNVAYELEVSLHDDECGCLETADYRAFEATVRRDHPLVWEWAADRHATNDTSYINRRNELGRNPKRHANPDAVPPSTQRQLTREERLTHKRRRARWAWADRTTYEAGEESLVQAFANGSRMTIAQAVKWLEIVDEIPSSA